LGRLKDLFPIQNPGLFMLLLFNDFASSHAFAKEPEKRSGLGSAIIEFSF
jgi:hypothetical protein